MGLQSVTGAIEGDRDRAIEIARSRAIAPPMQRHGSRIDRMCIQSDTLSGTRCGTGILPVPQKKDFFIYSGVKFSSAAEQALRPLPQKKIFLIGFFWVELSPVHQLFGKYYGLFILT